jgi:hypothetical protein
MKAVLLVPVALLQVAPPAADPTVDPAAAPAFAPAEPTWGPPPMPRDDEDFNADRSLFVEGTTDPEKARRAEIEAGLRPADRRPPLYARSPRLTAITQSAAGVFGGAVVGLLGGSIGESIDPADRRLPLGGPHGPLFGGLAGTMIGTTAGVWGSGFLFDKDPDRWGWTALGTTVGTVVGAGIATGFAAGMDKGDTASTLAVGSFVISQVAGAVIFDTLFQAPPPPMPTTVAPIPESEDDEY